MSVKLTIKDDKLSCKDLNLSHSKVKFADAKKFIDMLDDHPHDINYIEEIRSKYGFHLRVDYLYELCLDVNDNQQKFQDKLRTSFIKYMDTEHGIKIRNGGGPGSTHTFPVAILAIMHPDDRKECKKWSDIFKYVCVQYEKTLEEYDGIDILRQDIVKYERRLEYCTCNTVRCFCGQSGIKQVSFIEALTPFENGKIRAGFFGSTCILKNAKSSIKQWTNDDNIPLSLEMIQVFKKKPNLKKNAEIYKYIADDYEKLIVKLPTTTLTIYEQHEKKNDYEKKIKALKNIANVITYPKINSKTTEEKLNIAKRRLKEETIKMVTENNIMETIEKLRADDLWDEQSKNSIIKRLWDSVIQSYIQDFNRVSDHIVLRYLNDEVMTKDIMKYKNKIKKQIKSYPKEYKTIIHDNLNNYINNERIKSRNEKNLIKNNIKYLKEKIPEVKKRKMEGFKTTGYIPKRYEPNNTNKNFSEKRKYCYNIPEPKHIYNHMEYKYRVNPDIRWRIVKTNITLPNDMVYNEICKTNLRSLKIDEILEFYTITSFDIQQDRERNSEVANIDFHKWEELTQLGEQENCQDIIDLKKFKQNLIEKIYRQKENKRLIEEAQKKREEEHKRLIKEEQKKIKEKIKILQSNPKRTYRDKPVLTQYPATTEINDAININNYLDDNDTYDDIISGDYVDSILLKNPINTKVNICINYFKTNKMNDTMIHHQKSDEIKNLKEDLIHLETKGTLGFMLCQETY